MMFGVKIYRYVQLLLIFPLLYKVGTTQNIDKKNKPNIVYILADDLGYGELGCYGQDKIETPNIDALSRQGMLFTQHYAFPVCAPSRCLLLTGKNSGHAYIRSNNEWVARGDVWSYKAM